MTSSSDLNEASLIFQSSLVRLTKQLFLIGNAEYWLPILAFFQYEELFEI
jgi:hypothetical protein